MLSEEGHERTVGLYLTKACSGIPSAQLTMRFPKRRHYAFKPF